LALSSLKARKAQTLERQREREKRRKAEEEEAAAARRVERDSKGKGKATTVAPPPPPAADSSSKPKRRSRESADDAAGTTTTGVDESEPPTGLAGVRDTVSRYMPRAPDSGPAAPGRRRWDAVRAWIVDNALGRWDWDHPLRLGSLCFLALAVLQLVRYRRRRRMIMGQGGAGDWGLGQALALVARKVVDTAKMGTRVTYL
jgi:hypothetical protein